MAVPAEFDGQSAVNPAESIGIPAQLPRLSRRDLLRWGLPMGGLILAGGGAFAIRGIAPSDESDSNDTALKALDAMANFDKVKFRTTVAPSRVDRPGQDGLLISQDDRIGLADCAGLTPKVENRQISTAPEQRQVSFVYERACVKRASVPNRPVSFTDTLSMILEKVSSRWSLVSITR